MGLKLRLTSFSPCAMMLYLMLVSVIGTHVLFGKQANYHKLMVSSFVALLQSGPTMLPSQVVYACRL